MLGTYSLGEGRLEPSGIFVGTDRPHVATAMSGRTAPRGESLASLYMSAARGGGCVAKPW